MIATNIRTMLEDRGVRLRPGLSAVQLRALLDRFGSEVDQSILRMYAQFDGFEELDFASFHMVWPSSQIAPFAPMFDGISNFNIPCAWGDWLIDSDVLIFDLTDARKPVYFGYEKKIIATNLTDYYLRLAGGEYDMAHARCKNS